MHTRNSQAMQSDPMVQTAHRERLGCTVVAIDMALRETRDMVPFVSELTRHSDIIMLSNTKYRYVHSHLAFLPRDWAPIEFGDDVKANGEWKNLCDDKLYKTSQHVMSMTWRQLRRTPIEHSLMPQ